MVVRLTVVCPDTGVHAAGGAHALSACAIGLVMTLESHGSGGPVATNEVAY
jgi:hypothetical protein